MYKGRKIIDLTNMRTGYYPGPGYKIRWHNGEWESTSALDNIEWEWA